MGIATQIPQNLPNRDKLLNSTNQPNMTTTQNTKDKSPYYIPDDKNKDTFQNYFKRYQTVDGFIEGVEAKKLFLQSSLPPTFLAQIWSLVDTEKSGRLNENQFVLAMHLLRLKLK